MDDVSYFRNEESFDQCQFKNASNCAHSEDIVVACLSSKIQNGNCKLANPINIIVSGSWIRVWRRAEWFNPEKEINNWSLFCYDDFT